MSKSIFADELIEHVGEEITESFLLKSIGQKRNLDGRNRYIEFKFLDKTGEFTGYLYEEYMRPEYFTYKKRVVSLTGQIILRKDPVPKIYISNLEEATEYEEADYYSGLEPEEEKRYLEIIRQYAEKITHKGYQALVKGVYEDYRERIAQCPASLAGYCNYNGGVLAHTVAVTGIAIYSAKILAKYSKRGKNLDFQLLATASLLHEIGKIEEYTTFPLAQRISEGILLPTSDLTIRILGAVMHRHEILLTKEEEYLLYHLIETCTNEERFVKPMCMEAVIMQKAYQMQTRAEELGYFIEENRGKTGGIYDEKLENFVYVRKKEERESEDSVDRK